jgi:hypothetical protein
MTCRRCRGLMVFDRFLDVHGDSGHLWFRGWRCVACGDIVDPLILINRARPRPRVRARRWHRRVILVGAGHSRR